MRMDTPVCESLTGLAYGVKKQLAYRPDSAARLLELWALNNSGRVIYTEGRNYGSDVHSRGG
jgi:hypothetical protein